MMLFKKKILETVNGGFSDSDKIRLKGTREGVKILIKCTAIFIIFIRGNIQKVFPPCEDDQRR